MDIMKQELAPIWTQLLTVFYLAEPGSFYAAWQDDGGGYHWAGQGTTTNLVNASDELVALCLK